MEAELNVLRTATSNLQQQQSRPQRQPQNSPGQQLASPAPSGRGVNCDTCIVGKDCLCLSSATGETSAPSITVPQSPIKDSPETPDADCGLCSSSSCLCQDLGIRDSQQLDPPSPTSPMNLKRKRSKPPTSSTPFLPTPQSYPMEIDFTSSFTSSLSPTTHRDSLLSGGCGFCSDGTPCICLQNTLPPLQSDLSALTQEAHPEAIRRGGGRRPQVNDVKIFGSSIPRVGSPMTIASGNGGCTGEPGNLPSPIFLVG